jgi:arginyl-tRNA synthetase
MGYDSECFNVLLAQQVNLLDEGKPIVMSKRTGRFITMHTLLEEIPVDVSRYFFVMRSFESHLDFDFTEARDTSEKNPFYYVAYAHARIRSIFDKAAERGLASSLSKSDQPVVPSDFEMTPERRRLYWLISRFPEEVRDSAESLEPHRLVNFLYQLATAFSRFYNQKENRVIEQNPETAGALLDLLESVAVCLKNGLRLLGMEAPDRLTREGEEEES